MVLATEPFAETVAGWTAVVDRRLEDYLDAAASGRDAADGLDANGRLLAAMRYSLCAGGKRLRPLLVLLATDACTGPVDLALPAACAVEMIHTYSLIHDDLPAMDDDDLRRGQPTCHRKFGEALAILAGDALLTLAFETLTDLAPASVAVSCSARLARASGAMGMAGGQVDDLHPPDPASQAPERSLDWLRSMQRRKTGALLQVSLDMGAEVADADDRLRQALRDYGRDVGLAFQIADDLLDVEGDAVKMGKSARKDAAAGKLTYPHLLGVETSRQRAAELAESAKQSLAPFGPAGERLAALADYIVQRDR